MPVSKRHDSAPDAWWARFSVNGKRYQITIRAPNKRAAEALERMPVDAQKLARGELRTVLPLVPRSLATGRSTGDS
jgi:hypothetical protein